MISLDTNIAIAAIGNRNPAVRAKIGDALADGTQVVVSTIVLHELWYGIQASSRPKVNAKALENFLALGVAALPFDLEDAKAAAEIRAALRRIGRPIGPYDILIAGQALRQDAILVTANTAEFARVPRLRIENWTRP